MAMISMTTKLIVKLELYLVTFVSTVEIKVYRQVLEQALKRNYHYSYSSMFPQSRSCSRRMTSSQLCLVACLTLAKLRKFCIPRSHIWNFWGSWIQRIGFVSEIGINNVPPPQRSLTYSVDFLTCPHDTKSYGQHVPDQGKGWFRFTERQKSIKML